MFMRLCLIASKGEGWSLLLNPSNRLEFLPMGLNWCPIILFGDKLSDYSLPIDIIGKFLPNIPLEFLGVSRFTSPPSPDIFLDACLSKHNSEPSAF